MTQRDTTHCVRLSSSTRLDHVYTCSHVRFLREGVCAPQCAAADAVDLQKGTRRFAPQSPATKSKPRKHT